jgi:anthranilate synthase component 2
VILIIDNYDSFTYNLVHLVAGSPGGRGEDISAGDRDGRSPSASPVHPTASPPSASPSSPVQVFRNDRISLEEIEALQPTGILISPGPGRPADAGVTCAVIERFGERIPILGVCLGHQAIGEVFGGRVTYAPTLMHGKTSLIHHDGRSIFSGLAQDFVATRYHSLVVDGEHIPDELQVSASTPDGVVMGLRHRAWPVEGIQFHPESLLTTEGPRLIRNWVEMLLVQA